ncbi:hypothetical protein G3I40_28450 [Streptomyces sp. SID14478]|uniref:hypothetical protein n=1 Tax=Streptomyces sp. SID14478 TaxID=2706073 RepID=UPI0013DB6D8F|nr:hypothetical protein [Streptomyces sp. SID14478]NEB79120.1 hypothetical protein [Streptomyces sp. SID14478]
MKPILHGAHSSARRSHHGVDEHTLPDQSRDSASADALGALYDRHAAELYTLACLLCEDNNAAQETFVEAMSRGALVGDGDAGPREQRRRLVVELWDAIRARAVRRRRPRHGFADAAPRARGRGDGDGQGKTLCPAPACGTKKALLGVTLLGGHTYQQAAELFGLEAGVAARHLREELRAQHRERIDH